MGDAFRFCLLLHTINRADRTITLNYLEDNFNAIHIELTPEESQNIRDLVEKASVFGERYPMEHALALFADTPLPEDWKEVEQDSAIAGQTIGRIILDQK